MVNSFDNIDRARSIANTLEGTAEVANGLSQVVHFLGPILGIPLEVTEGLQKVADKADLKAASAHADVVEVIMGKLNG